MMVMMMTEAVVVVICNSIAKNVGNVGSGKNVYVFVIIIIIIFADIISASSPSSLLT